MNVFNGTTEIDLSTCYSRDFFVLVAAGRRIVLNKRLEKKF